MWRDKASLLQPDARHSNTLGHRSPTGQYGLTTIEDLYEDIAPFHLPSTVPEDIIKQFDIARNAYIYSWFDYEMVTLAEEHMYTVIEMALRRKAKDENTGMDEKTPMSGAISHARARGWLKDDDFGFVDFGGPKPVPMLDMVVKMRNDLMHGNHHLLPNGSLEVVELCFDIIKRLFPLKT